MTTVVVKLGGSLYDLPDLGERLTALLAASSDHHFLIFPGGGEAADLVRQWQPRFGWTDAVAHEVAIAALDFNAEMLANVLPRGCVIRDRNEALRAWQCGAQPVLAPALFLRDEELRHPTTVLPHNWDVTSDSLAAWTALHWPAAELWLCKSVSCPPGDAAMSGSVDSQFTAVAGKLPRVCWCNLRDGNALVDVLSQPGARATAENEIMSDDR